MKGPFGYGRYDDDPAHVGCPRAWTDMSPCIARDGGLAVADNNKCVGCGSSPGELLKEIGVTPTSNQPKAAADALCVEVLRVTDPNTAVPVKGRLSICWSCRTPTIVVDGKSQHPVTLWKRDGQTMVTPHAPQCELRGKADTDKRFAGM